MTTSRDEGTGAGFGGRSPDGATTVATILRSAGVWIRRDPIPIVLFAIAGLVVAVADWLRRWDPIPVARPAHLDQTVAIQHSIFPRGIAQTVRPVGALVDLRTPYFAGAIAIELVVVLAVGLAGWLTITRVLGVDRDVGSFLRYQGVFSVVVLVPWALGFPSIEFDNLLFGLGAFVVVLLLWIRLFLVPGYLATGESIVGALRRSLHETADVQRTLGGLVLVLGVGCWGLFQLPHVGGFLTTAVIGLVHAVVIAVVLDRTEKESSGSTRANRPARL